MKSNLSTLPEWLRRDLLIIGFDNDDEGDGDDNSDDEDGDDEDEDEDSSEDESDEGSDEDEEDDDEDKPEEDPSAGLKSALRKERKGHKAERRQRIELENENKKLKATLEGKSGKESEAVTTIQKELDSERTKTSSLAKKIKDQAISQAIINEARKQGFVDPEDALSIAKEIEADQDADDPTDIDIDEDSVKVAVKDLATRKKHLIGEPQKKTTSTTKSGSKSTRRKKTKTTPKDELIKHYPGLQ